ncbi:hypothetical protein RFI_05144 [Reticulomyxa filosa]|uniref:Anaphase-promoting complex subunit 4 WD40 domain-containing protein n=1 Tax=Reticulomyxa filosa TaxID=46433 RepID=X6P1N6_RETFI|nr:hypothetical protein RFI_05144 [Reticulomyxa filosa]|eukprot:ETO31974.1 hypothetical protein RFI_05144 [Reticulomyxa filosa]
MEKSDGHFSRVNAICWSFDNEKLAIATADRYITLFDDNGQQKDRFSTKASDTNKHKIYRIVGLSFSPDSTKLAVAQSDNIVFVYRLGTGWDYKKSICHKLVVSSNVTCMLWPHSRNDELVFGLSNGKLKVGILQMDGVRKNKSATLFETQSYVVTLACGSDGNSFISSHMDRTLHKYKFPTATGAPFKELLATLPYVGTCIVWSHDTLLVGSNLGHVVALNSNDGTQLQIFEFNIESCSRSLYCAASNPQGQCAIFGGFN